MFSLILLIKFPLTILLQTFKEFEKPIKSVPPWLLTTGESSPKKIAPLYSWGSCDIDYKWQVPGVKYWLEKNGFKNKN